MTATVESFIQEHARRYSDHDPEAVTELCLHPFLAIRGGRPIHLPDRDAVRDHFAMIMDTDRRVAAGRLWSATSLLEQPGIFRLRRLVWG
jgi:hypothetical protein